ncbi:MAG: SRPBCC domain-containing protein, partial [Pseudorhodoplanes sp.]
MEQTTPLAAQDRALVITRLFDAPRSLVFAAWTDPRHVAKWWGPRDYPAAAMQVEARPGGRWSGVLRHESGTELRLGGVYHEVLPPERLVFTFSWDEEGERGMENLVT